MKEGDGRWAQATGGGEVYCRYGVKAGGDEISPRLHRGVEENF